MFKFNQISNFQAIVRRKVKLLMNNLITNELAKIFQDICRVRADHIQFVAKGTFSKGRKMISDERRWE
jgi:hypothetical protein